MRWISEQVTGNPARFAAWCRAEHFCVFTAPLVRYCLLPQLGGGLKKWYVKDNVDKKHFVKFLSTIQVPFFVEICGARQWETGIGPTGEDNLQL